MIKEDIIGTKEQRLKCIGGSEFGTVLDINPYKKRIELILEKAGVIVNDFKGNEATKRGERLEDSVIELFEKTTGILVGHKQQEFTYQPENCLLLKCHVDGITSNDCVFEAKTTDIKAKTWENGIPEYYKAQLDFNCFLAKKQKAYIAVGYCNGEKIEKFEFHEYKAYSSGNDIMAIIRFCQLFTADIENYKNKFGVVNNGKIISSDFPNAFIEELEIINDTIKEIKQTASIYEKRKKEIEEQIKAEINNNGGFETDIYRITLGNRITQPSEVNITRSNIKIEHK